MLVLSCADFFQNLLFNFSFENIIRVPNCLNPDHDRHFVGPDLGPNCLQSFSTDEKYPIADKRLDHVSVE